MESVALSGTGYFVPSDSVSTEEIVASFNEHVKRRGQQLSLPLGENMKDSLQESCAKFVVQASGIKNRRVIDKRGILDPDIMHPLIPARKHTELSIQCEMAFHAAKEALAQAGKKPQDIDAVIVACSGMQRPYPAISIELQEALGIRGFAYDMNAACSSASFGIHMAKSLILSQSARCVLTVNPEVYTAHLNFKDRRSHFIFGDGCSAAIIEKETSVQSKHGYRILGSKVQSQFSNNIRNNFGFLNRCEKDSKDPDEKLFHQNGRKVREEVVPLASQHILAHLSEKSIAPNDLKRLWLHQANINMNQAIAKNVLGRDPNPNELPLILEEYGNTGASGMMIAFTQSHQDLKRGDLGVLCSFGAGYTVGSVLLEKLS